jgi:hypothetical protein
MEPSALNLLRTPLMSWRVVQRTNEKKKMNNHTTFFVLSRTVLASLYVRVHYTKWEDRQRIPMVGS